MIGKEWGMTMLNHAKTGRSLLAQYPAGQDAQGSPAPPAPVAAGTPDAVGGAPPDTAGGVLVHELRERTRLMAELDSFDTLGEYLKLDMVEHALMRQDAAFRTSIAVQRDLLERARQVVDEGDLHHRPRYLERLQRAFLASMGDAVRSDADWDALLRDATTYAEQQMPGNLRASVRAYRAIQRAYLWRRLLWALWRYAFFITGLVTLLLVAVIATPGRSAPVLLAIAVALILAWLLARTLLAGFVERAVVHQRRRALRAWTRDLSAAQLRLQPEMVLAVMALEHGPYGTQTPLASDTDGSPDASLVPNGAADGAGSVNGKE